jgi:MFS family permease
MRQLLTTNRNYRLLWMGQVVSQLGDWFNYVALYALLFELTGGSATTVASLMVVQMLPVAFVGPWAGVLVDRFDRRRIMIAADVVRGVAILGLLFVRTPATIWLAFVVTGFTVSASGFFEPARSATIPSIVAREDLVTANAISTATWSAMLAIGASLGGGVAAAFGRDVAFALNSASFFLSAFFIWRMRIERVERRSGSAGWHGLVEGLRYMRAHPPVAWIALVKGGWAVVGGALLLLTVFGDRIFRIGDSGDAGIGILYAARGIGAAMGSMLVTSIARRSTRSLTDWIGPSYLAAGLAYATLGFAPSIWFAAATVVVAHTFGSILWVSSNVLLQASVPDNFRGRVFAAELVFLSAMQSLVAALTAQALDRFHVSPRPLAVVIGLSLWIPAAVWYGKARRQCAGT